MEKINLVELLKDCPKGMKLDCTIWNNVKFDHIDISRDYPIYITIEGSGCEQLTEYGQFDCRHNAKCVIFPKGKTTWEGFNKPFEDGDILISGLEDCDNIPFIFKQTNGFGNAQCYCAINCYKELILNNDNWTPIKGCRLATEEEKQKLFDIIKANGYKWNPKTKSLEKLPKFKDGDIVFTHTSKYDWVSIFKQFSGNTYHTYVDLHIYSNDLFTNTYILCDIEEINTQRLATKEEKQKLFQAIKDNGYVWNPETKTLEKLIVPNFKVGDRIKKRGLDDCYTDEIADIVPPLYIFKDRNWQYYQCGNWQTIESVDKEYELVINKFDINTLKPFESKVLVRNTDHHNWCPAIFGCKLSAHTLYKYATMTENYYAQCIPYEGNEHLSGTTNDCDEFYKNW